MRFVFTMAPVVIDGLHESIHPVAALGSAIMQGKVPVVVHPVIEVPRHEAVLGPAKTLSWWSMGQKAVVMCSNGHSLFLGETHTIQADGQVMPSLVCGIEGCGFHKIVRLMGWEAGS